MGARNKGKRKGCLNRPVRGCLLLVFLPLVNDDDMARIEYDPTNGTQSPGDIVFHRGSPYADE